LKDRIEKVNSILEGCIYKYGPIDNLTRTLEKTTIGFSSLFDFNDIYEYEYRIVHYFNSIEERKKLLGPMTPFGRQQQIIDNRLKSIKVSCFSYNANNNLMWSHYAKDHTGICYCFEKKSIFEERNIPWGKVQYSSSIPELPIFQGKTTEGMLHAHIDSVILTKSIEWAYENENRFFKCQDNNYRNYVPSSLKAIIVGRRTDDKTIKNIKKQVEEFNKKHNATIEILYAYRNQGSYSLGIDWDLNFRNSCETNFGAGIPVRDDLNTPLVTMEVPSETNK